MRLEDIIPHELGLTWQSHPAMHRRGRGEYAEILYQGLLTCRCRPKTVPRPRPLWASVYDDDLSEEPRIESVDRTVRIYRNGKRRGQIVHIRCGRAVGAVDI